MERYYLTTAIDYSNGDPHLGHALEKVGADCIARYRRLRGDQVHFLMGMDEHSQSVIAAAERGGVTGLFLRSSNGALPSGTRFIEFTLTNRVVTGMNDASADKLSVVLTTPPIFIQALGQIVNGWQVTL